MQAKNQTISHIFDTFDVNIDLCCNNIFDLHELYQINWHRHTRVYTFTTKSVETRSETHH